LDGGCGKICKDGVEVGRDVFYIAFELAFSDMKDLISHHRSPVPLEIVRYFFQQILSAIWKCHTKGIVHRDLKLENILVTSDY